MICMFSHCFEAFPCRRAMALTVGKLLLERIIPVWGIPTELHADHGTHFTRQIIKSICNIWPIMQHFHCTYNHQSSGLVERTNSIIKTQLAKLSETFTLSRPKALMLVLFNLRSILFVNIGCLLFK